MDGSRYGPEAFEDQSMPIAVVHPMLFVTFILMWALICQLTMRRENASD